MWNWAIPAVSSLIGGGLNMIGQSQANDRAEDVAANQQALQREFATTGITWRARDIMRASGETGIHPLALLGVQGATYSPVTTAFAPESMGDAVSRAGQDIGNAIHRNADRALRERQLEMQEIQMNNLAERGALENEALRLQIASQRMRLAQMNAPSVPSTSAPGRMIDTTRLHMGITDNLELARETSSTPAIGLLKMPDGSYMPVKSKEATERLEDDVLGNLKHFFMRELGPSFWEKDPGRPARPGHRWTVNFWGNWVEVPERKPQRWPEADTMRLPGAGFRR